MKDEAGSISLLLSMGALLFCLFALGVADLGSMLLARSRAQSAADAAALAAVVQQTPVLGQGSDPENAARAMAEANGASLVSCSCKVGDFRATVEVTLAPRIVFVSGWRGRAVHATARAEVNPDVLTYRDPG
ncbi:MAG: Rv3654c family TadE-like protein [Actinomycetota bacterium]|nr:pilus assembly protein TadG-related protein [Actinomycetota bacterium]